MVKLNKSLHTIPGGFTVLMAVYHKDDPILFNKAIYSIYQNTLQPDDFVLVVDGHVSVLLEQIIAGFQRQFAMRVIWLPENRGLANALNQGLKAINTTWVARADADDINMPYRFKILAQNIGDDIDLIGAAIREIDEGGRVTGSRTVPLSHVEICKYLKRRNPFNHMTVMFRRELVMEFGGYPNLFLREDYALWATLLSSGMRAINLADELVEVSAGISLAKRRGGFRYAIAEINLQVFLVRVGIKSIFLAIIDGVLRGFIFCLPWCIRAKIYKAFLRKH